MTRPLEAFELSMLGGAVERRYRRLRPEVEALPWGTLKPERYPAHIVRAAQELWTEAAFQEHRTGAACAATLQAMIAARAPVDLIAMASRFPLDEMVHVELCARLAMELGGGVRLLHDPREMFIAPDPSAPPLLQAAELVVRNFCVGEALSIPLLRGSWHAARHPLIKAVLGRIVKDEAAHGQFGWLFLDWADEQLGTSDRERLASVAEETMHAIAQRWKRMEAHPGSETEADALGWMESRTYLALARRSMQRHVIAPLRERGLDVTLRE